MAVRAADGVFGRIARAFTAPGDDGCALESGFGRLREESAAADSSSPDNAQTFILRESLCATYE